MPGSKIPDKLREWPLNADGVPDTEGMAHYCSEHIGQYGQELTVFCQRVDQAAVDDILDRLRTCGAAGLKEDDVEHVMNALALAYAQDEISTARACIMMLAEYVELNKKRRAAVN